MDYIIEQLRIHRLIMANIFFLETIYTFYLGRSVVVLFLRLLFYSKLLTFDGRKAAVPPAPREESGSANEQAEREAGAASRAGTAAGAATTPNYLGTGTRPSGAASNATTNTSNSTSTPQDQQQQQQPRRDAGAGSVELTFDNVTEEELEDRKGTMLRDIIITFAIALFNHFIIPLLMGGWTWYWVGPANLRPDKKAFTDKYGKAEGAVRYHAAVSSAFVKDYATWHAQIDQNRYYMDFMAAEEPPANLLYRLYGGNQSLPLFLTLIDVFIVVLQLVLLKMTFPEAYGLHITVAPAPPPSPSPPAAAADDEGSPVTPNNAASRGPREGAAEGGVNAQAGNEADLGRGERPCPTPQPREESEAGERKPTCSSQSSENSNGSGNTTTIRRKHHGLSSNNGGGGDYEKLLSMAGDKGSRGSEGKMGQREEVDNDVDVFVDLSNRSSGGVGGGPGGKYERMEMDLGDPFSDGEGTYRSGGSRRRRFLGRLASPLQWFSLSGGLISGGGGGKTNPLLSSPTPPSHSPSRRGVCGGGSSSRGQGSLPRLPVRHGTTTTTSASSSAAATAMTSTAVAAMGLAGATQKRSIRSLWYYVRHLLRTASRSLVQGWRWDLLTIDVPADQVPASVAGTLLTIDRGGRH